MKKSLLLFAASILTMSASAAGFGDNLSATIGGEPITEGAVYRISDYEDFESLVPGMGYNYSVDIEVKNNTASNITTGILVEYTDNPTEAMAKADPDAWGRLQICVFGAAEGNNCLQELDIQRTVKGNSTMKWQFDNTDVSATRQESDRKYHITLTAEGTFLEFDVIFNPVADPKPVEDGFNGHLTATVNNKEVVDGDVFKISDYEDFESLVPGMGYNYSVDIEVKNNTASNITTGILVEYTDNPTEAMAKADPDAWGRLQICVFGAAEGNNCLQELDIQRTVKGNSAMKWQFDNTDVSATRGELNRKYHVTLTGENTSLEFDVIFNPGVVSGIETVEVSNDAVYFDLQGRRVANPEKGLYIVKQNGETSKVIVR